MAHLGVSYKTLTPFAGRFKLSPGFREAQTSHVSHIQLLDLTPSECLVISAVLLLPAGLEGLRVGVDMPQLSACRAAAKRDRHRATG